MTNVKELRKSIKNSGMTVTSIANKSEISRETLYNRMRSGDFKLSEICAISNVLRLTRDERDRIFFGNESELKSTNLPKTTVG